MSRRRAKHRSPFVTLSRHRRGNAVIRLKGKIRRDAAEHGGCFTSHLVLNEPGLPDLYRQWFQFYFPGSDRFTLWNATIVTARKAFWDQASDIACNRVAALLTLEELKQDRPKFEPAERSHTGKVLSYAQVGGDMRFAQFGGLTFREQWRKVESEIVRNEPPQVRESFTLDRSYVYGIGLRIVLDVEVIDRAAIEMAIERFLAIGETDWVAAEAVPCERLPTVSESEALASIERSPAETKMSGQ